MPVVAVMGVGFGCDGAGDATPPAVEGAAGFVSVAIVAVAVGVGDVDPGVIVPVAGAVAAVSVTAVVSEVVVLAGS